MGRDDGIKRRLNERLTKKRYEHSLAVGKRAFFLAGINGENTEKAALAGLLHDCCHSLPKEEQLKIIESHGILLDDLTLAQPQLWHALAGSISVREEFEISDEEIVSAVRLHTTGAKNMTRFEQIIYLADLTSSDRDYPDSDFYRRLSEENLALCMFKNLEFTIKTLTSQNAPIVRDAWEAYNYFWKLTR